MRTITSIILLITMAFFTACEGPTGPRGEDGLDGFDGTSLTGQIFEIEGDFTEGNNYTLHYDFPNDFEIYTTDIVMVYILWDQVDSPDGLLDRWRALPQTMVIENQGAYDGVYQYNFDYTVSSVNVFVDFTVDELLPEESENQIFRVAVLPAADALSVDLNDMNAVMKLMDVSASSVKKISMTK